jgi:hypothetical protein
MTHGIFAIAIAYQILQKTFIGIVDNQYVHYDMWDIYHSLS